MPLRTGRSGLSSICATPEFFSFTSFIVGGGLDTTLPFPFLETLLALVVSSSFILHSSTFVLIVAIPGGGPFGGLSRAMIGTTLAFSISSIVF